jgi:hypothetical protein
MNVGVGYAVLIIWWKYNTGIGSEFSNILHQTRNTLVGHRAGNNISSGNDNTCVGYRSGVRLRQRRSLVPAVYR